jgi:nucleotide-binding universal stress UspA family protein
MTFVVPFDGTRLSEAALVRAREFSNVLDERVVAVTVVPQDDVQYARSRGWLHEDEPFERGRIVASLHERVTELAPEADFRHVTVDHYAPTATIARELKRIAEQEGASMVFIGSDNAGKIVSTVSSVGGKVASNDDYDVVIVRNATPSEVAALRQSSYQRGPKPDFYFPD